MFERHPNASERLPFFGTSSGMMIRFSDKYAALDFSRLTKQNFLSVKIIFLG
mgnify:CR=1 FL=1